MTPWPLLLTGALAAPALAACGPAWTEHHERTVAAAFYPLQYVAERVAGDHYEVDNLTTPGMEPHDLELSIRQTALVSDAPLVIHLSDFQPAVDRTIAANAEGVVLDAADFVDLAPPDEHVVEHPAEHGDDDHGDHEHADEDGHDDHAEGHDGHDHGDLDPHFWQDPLRLADLGDAVAHRLEELDPDHADDYTRNAAGLRADLERLDHDYADGLARCARDTIVVGHDAFGYLAKYGLHVDSIVGLSPDAEPTPAALARLRTLISDEAITTVFGETLASTKTAETLARSAGVRSAVLDPLEGLPAGARDEDYLSLMRANLAALEEANGC